MSDRYLHAIWCDDIRIEIGNKPSFMGTYTAGINIPFTPFGFPKMCVYLWASTPIERPFQKAVISVTRDDGTVLAQFNMDNPQEAIDNLEAAEDAKTLFLMFGLNVVPFEIVDGCKYFSITMETESEILEGPKLRVTVVPPQP